MVNIYQISGKVSFNCKVSSINYPLPVLQGNEQDFGDENIVNTTLTCFIKCAR